MPRDPPQIQRDQLVLFSERLDDVLPADHLLRRMVEILDQPNRKAGKLSTNTTELADRRCTYESSVGSFCTG